jgi:Cu(I)/Ag(I) efflux system membrane fusion protein
MKPVNWIGALLLAIVAGGLGWFANDRFAASEAGPAGPCPGGLSPAHWRAPMDPTYVRNEPGKSPMGMDLIPVCTGDTPGSMSEPAAAGVVEIDPTVIQNIGVRSVRVERRDMVRHIRTVGRVAWDERRVSHVHTKVQGWIERLHVQFEGQRVERGQPLLEIYSPELVSAQEELLIASRYREATAASPIAEVSRGGSAMFDATRRRLALWDIPDAVIEQLLESGEIRKTLSLYAPTRGIVTSLGVREGMEVGPAQNLYMIGDLERVWIQADIYESDLPWVAVGQRGTVDLSYLPGRHFEGPVTFIDPFLDPKTRTARVRIELDNPDELLKPDMFANVTLATETRPDVIAVPDEAILRTGRRNIAIVAIGAGRFEPRPVVLGLDAGDGWVEIRHGLSEGDEVVVSGQFLIDSESRLQEAVQKLLSGDAPTSDTRDATGHAGHAPEHP